ncbi:methyl-accepting chemotaxis protein [Acidithiobacillus ferrooxidans]|uniref:methyl-accepting chemotaxis protein n=1 Tax=Acidithiobacillus ferrooxidans TaxID=920 RepID=UPI001C07C1D3|nr:methyl-accepting chemotaxis protein [Acidithiobacillus ferrooxidans]MBU2857358.1 methyl-accepting chemotaxis protein [Acidithiobacillus ferrooxidans]
MNTPFNISAISSTKLVQALVWIAISSLIVIVAVATWALFTAEHSGVAALHDAERAAALNNFRQSEDANIALTGILATEQQYEPVVYLALRREDKTISHSFARLQQVSPQIANRFSGAVNVLRHASNKVLLLSTTLRQAKAMMDYQNEYLPLVMKFNSNANTIAANQNRASQAASTENTSADKRVNILLVIVGLSAMALVFLFGSIIVRSLIRQLQRISTAIQRIASGDLNVKVPMDVGGPLGEITMATNQMATDLSTLIKGIGFSAQQISETCVELSSVANTLTEKVVDTSAQTGKASDAMTNMTTTSVRVAQDAEDISKIASVTSDSTQQGNAAIGSSLQELSSAGSAIVGMAQEVQKLEESSHQIGGIVSTIKEITAKTNLLALNAAIESARAGEYGRGFAVVADEVRNLAKGTAVAAEDVSAKVMDIQSQMQSFARRMAQTSGQVSHGTEMAGESLNRLGSINKSIANISERISDVATSAEELRNTASTINNNIMMISQKTIGINSEIETTQAQIVTLRDESKRLTELTGRFRVT